MEWQKVLEEPETGVPLDMVILKDVLLELHEKKMDMVCLPVP